MKNLIATLILVLTMAMTALTFAGEVPFYHDIEVAGVNMSYLSQDSKDILPSALFANLHEGQVVSVLVNAERNVPHFCAVGYIAPNGNLTLYPAKAEPGYAFVVPMTGVYAFMCAPTKPGQADLIGQVIMDGNPVGLPYLK